MFKDARNNAGMSREAAAFRLHIGVRTLNNYENGHTLTPPDVALHMSELYNQPELKARYCSEYCPIGQRTAHSVCVKDLATSVLGLLKEYNDVKGMRDKLISIAEDGVIDHEEMSEMQRILRELFELERAIETIKLSVAKLIPVDDIIQEIKRKKIAARATAI